MYRQVWLAIAHCDEEYDECLVDYQTECARMAKLILATQVRSLILCNFFELTQSCEGAQILPSLSALGCNQHACITWSAFWRA